MAAYVDLAYLKITGSMPASDLDTFNSSFPGVIDGICAAISRLFDAKLAKRYKVPFNPVPEIVKLMVTDVVMLRLWRKRGFNPGSEQDQDAIIQASKDALAWLNEAADAEKGFIELPRRETDDPNVDAVTKGFPLGYSEQSPYVWTDAQVDEAMLEDTLRRGS